MAKARGFQLAGNSATVRGALCGELGATLTGTHVEHTHAAGAGIAGSGAAGAPVAVDGGES